LGIPGSPCPTSWLIAGQLLTNAEGLEEEQGTPASGSIGSNTIQHLSPGSRFLMDSEGFMVRMLTDLAKVLPPLPQDIGVGVAQLHTRRELSLSEKPI